MIEATEILITAVQNNVDGNSIDSSILDRIQALIKSHLQFISVDSSGWSKLYQDPIDDRYWEFGYPNSSMHGGGTPQLVCLSETEAHTKYEF